jgi:hypothetical protein
VPYVATVDVGTHGRAPLLRAGTRPEWPSSRRSLEVPEAGRVPGSGSGPSSGLKPAIARCAGGRWKAAEERQKRAPLRYRASRQTAAGSLPRSGA